MKKTLPAITAAIVLMSGASQAQELNDFNGIYAVGEIGYENGEGGFDQFIYGGALGGNLRLDENFYAGIEGELHGSADNFVDFTYGVHANLGYILREGTSVFARAGYREFEFDGAGSDGDYSLGLGTQFGLSERISVRTIVDTVAFDTIGARAGLVFDF